jgi:imidazolonepropionase-like amidohydrolase
VILRRSDDVIDRLQMYRKPLTMPQMLARMGVQTPPHELARESPRRMPPPAPTGQPCPTPGITIIPGTDALSGYSLHHELELCVRAGIPAPEVLRMATLTPSQVMGVTTDLGIMAARKLADMDLIDGDPAKNIRDTGNITTVIKGGKIYDPAAIEKAMGIIPRPTTRQ